MDPQDDQTDAENWRQAQLAGRVVRDIPLSRIVMEHMMRDRMVVDGGDLAELKASIRLNGLRLPIEVEPLPEGDYGLISGWRRMSVLHQLCAEDPDRPATVAALIRHNALPAASYTAMVEENELRAQITPYERGRIVVMAAQLGAFGTTDSAIDAIFATASRAKRSKIRSFAYLHEELGDMLQFPTDLSERNGLRLCFALREGFGPQLRHTLIRSTPLAGAVYEWDLLEPIITAAEAIERQGPTVGRPRSPNTRAPLARPSGRIEDLANGISMERVLHEDGYSIRLRGRVVDIEMIELMMSELRRRLSPLPVRMV